MTVHTPRKTANSTPPALVHTPYKRAESWSSVSASSKTKVNRKTLAILDETDVDNANVNDDVGPICVITRQRKSNGKPIQYSHVLAKSTPSLILWHLERAWDMHDYTLNVNRHDNIQTLDVHYHATFDAGDWFWYVNDQDIVNYMYMEYVGQREERKVPYVCKDPNEFYDGKTKFSYKLAHFSQERTPLPILCYDNPNDDSYSTHSFPYTSLQFELHIPPHFVICNTGQKLVKEFGENGDIQYWNFPQGLFKPIEGATLGLLRDIYLAWVKPRFRRDNQKSSNVNAQSSSRTPSTTRSRRARSHDGTSRRSLRSNKDKGEDENQEIGKNQEKGKVEEHEVEEMSLDWEVSDDDGETSVDKELGEELGDIIAAEGREGWIRIWRESIKQWASDVCAADEATSKASFSGGASLDGTGSCSWGYDEETTVHMEMDVDDHVKRIDASPFSTAVFGTSRSI